MNEISVRNRYTGFSRITLFLALSRTPHGLLDMATPALGALLWLGAFPPLKIIALGLVTVFAGYTAVYALNDVVDYRIDKEKFRTECALDSCADLDAMMIRHPMAQGHLSFTEGLLWTVIWSAVAMAGAYILNPVCIVIFLIGCALETVYCLLLRVSHLRTVVSGGVKTAGAIAGVFAVDAHPSPWFILMLFVWLFFWEIGGQNVPNDLTDIEADRRIHARTVPVRLGFEKANQIIMGSLILVSVLAVAVFYLSPIPFELPYVVAVISTGLFLLVLPAAVLFKTRAPQYAMALFNMSSHYPVALLAVVAVKLAAG